MSNKIESMFTNKHHFSPYDKGDISLARKFLSNNRWGKSGCPFYLEWPYLDIPSMLKDKITKHCLDMEND